MSRLLTQEVIHINFVTHENDNKEIEDMCKKYSYCEYNELVNAVDKARFNLP